MKLTVIEDALIDLQQGQEAMARRQRQFGDPAVLKAPADSDPRLMTPWTLEDLDRLLVPVRIEISFEDPLETRKQLEVLMGHFTEALMVTQDHARGMVRQRRDLRSIIKTAADLVVLMRGKTPTGRSRRKS